MAFAALVTPMIMVKHDQIQGLLGDLSLATPPRGAKERMDHLDQRGGPHNGVERIEHQGFEEVKGLAKEPCGARQPALAFSVMVALVFGPGLGDEMSMVPCQHEKIQGLVRHHGTECTINRFGLGKRDSPSINVLVHGCERVGHGSAVECGDHVEKPRQFRAHAFDGGQSAMRRAEV